MLDFPHRAVRGGLRELDEASAVLLDLDPHSITLFSCRSMQRVSLQLGRRRLPLRGPCLVASFKRVTQPSHGSVIPSAPFAGTATDVSRARIVRCHVVGLS